MFLALLFLTSAIAFAISTVSGGGAGLLLLPVLGLGLAAAQVPVALTVGSTISSLARLGLFLRGIEWRVVRWFVPFSLPGALLGVWLLQHMSPLYLEAVLGLFLLGNLPLLFKPANEAEVKLAGSATLMKLGFVAGFVSGLTGAVGLLFNRFYLRYGLSKEQIVATRAANEILVHLTKLGLYAAFGLFTTDALGAGMVVGMASVAAVYGVRWVLPYLSEMGFRRLGYAAMVTAGAVMSVNAGRGLATQHQIDMTSYRVHRGFDLALSGFGRSVSIEFRHNELPEIEYLVDFEQLPAELRAKAAPLIEGAERVVVEAVVSWRRLAYEIHVHRDGLVVKYDI
ncbi:sulfite exporter TauE/SafE family protein [Luteibacter sp.]|jgi:hypothetical protein|uniref:sulfite exporter TauE/SafE family protein n=1 Tax=Luteibacter sp. TaxID=1886636 RepID=UPI002F40DC1A